MINLDTLKAKIKHEVLPKEFIQVGSDEMVQFHLHPSFDPCKIVSPKLLTSTILTSDLKLHSFVHGVPVPLSVFNDLVPVFPLE